MNTEIGRGMNQQKVLFISDDLTAYEASKASWKLYYRDCYFKKQQGFDTEKVERFNFTSAITIEFKAARRMHDELERVIQQLQITGFQPNRFVATLPKRDQLYSYFYEYFKKYVLLKHLFLLSLEQFVKEFSSDLNGLTIQLKLSSDLRLIEDELKITFPKFHLSASFYSGELIRKFNPRFATVKKYLYPVYEQLARVNQLLKRPAKRSKCHLLLLTYDVSSDSLLLEHFYDLIKANPSAYSLSIVQIATGMEARHTFSFDYLAGKNIDVYRYEVFRKYARQNRNEKYFENLRKAVPASFACLDEKHHFKSYELHYEWTSNMLDKLKPDVCLYTNQGEMGRVLSQVARCKSIPSVFVEYSFTFNSPFLESNIAFSLRACINKITAANWKKSQDPSTIHAVLGYCKHDYLSQQEPDKQTFFEANGFDWRKKSVLFASTWCSGNKIYDDEKAEILRGLSEICHTHDWNLLVKKHPVEVDLIVDEVLDEKKYPGQKVFTNAQLPLAKAVQMTDFMCCQSSSAVLDSVYFEKPFAFVSLTDGESLADYLMADKQNKIDELTQMDELEKYLVDLFQHKHPSEAFQRKSKALKRDLLYLADGNACQRLMDVSVMLAEGSALDAKSLETIHIEKIESC